MNDPNKTQSPSDTAASPSPKLPYQGITVLIGEREFVVPSLSVNQARTLWPEILDLNQGLTVQQFPAKLEQVLRIIHAAVSRNYPDLTLEMLGDMVSSNNTGDILMAVAQASGFTTSTRRAASDGDAGNAPTDPPQPVLH